MADSISAITAFHLNNEFNLFGRKTYLIRMVSKYFPVIDDAPVEKQGSWVKNLVTGLVVTAALAACAVFVVATGGLGLGAVMLIGALMHEYQHYLDDVANGFSGMSQLFDLQRRCHMELSVYMKEIKLAESIGRYDVANQLFDNYINEREYILDLLKPER